METFDEEFGGGLEIKNQDSHVLVAMCIDNPRRKEKIGLNARNILVYSCLFGREDVSVRKRELDMKCVFRYIREVCCWMGGI